MGLFTRAPRESPRQIPDELAEKAAVRYGNQDFVGAFQTYAEAIDKIHTMCVVADRSSRVRAPGPDDQPVLDGFSNALGATLAINPGQDVGSTVQRTLLYLNEIAGEAGPETDRYRRAIDDIDITYRLGKGR